MVAKDNKFLLVSLEETKAKKLAQVVSNDTCRKILDFLTTKDGTETKIAEELDIPLSTTHYNLQQLVDAGLVKVDEFHYSEKGKEVNHYTLANKYIIIAPKTTHGIAGKLKHILPVAGVVAVVGGMMQFLQNQSADYTVASANAAVAEAAPATAKALDAVEVVAPAQEPSMAMWFVIGGVFALVLYGLYVLVLSKITSK
ncbi:MAG: helix-turn-helix domain-containing protein [Anaerolineales bacterium]|nr:helix-turn-helix domain-containing protein [Anaerolineales bacterium]